jgi:hypothetical protein
MIHKEQAVDMIRKTVIVILSVAFYMLLTTASHADDADVLPKGVSKVTLKSQFYFPVDKRFDDDGNTEDVAEDFNADLNSNVFPALAAIEAGFGMPAGSATLGETEVDFEYRFVELDFYYFYGLTKRVTVGIHVPYWWNKTKVKKAELNTTNATVGKTAIGTGVGAPLAPLAGPFPDTVPLTTEDVQDLIGNGLDTNGDGNADIPGLGFDRFETWDDSDFSDIEIGARYQYLKTNDWRLASTGAVRFPTGDTDDPDNLQDFAFGEGVYALLFDLNNDYVGIKNLVLNATFRYELRLPDKKEIRVPENTDQVLIPPENKEQVDRDLGDTIEVETSASYEFLKGSSFLLLYQYGYRFKDDIDGDKGLNYNAAEDETNIEEHIFKAGISYSTIPLYQEKKFPVPLEAFVLYRNRFAGKNALKSQYISFGLSVFF